MSGSHFYDGYAKTECHNYHVAYTGFFGNLHRLKNSPSTVCVPNMNTITFCSTPKRNNPGLVHKTEYSLTCILT